MNIIENESIILGKYYNAPIEWIILQKQEGKALIITKNIIDMKEFNFDQDMGNKYSSSNIRDWLTNEFFSASFSQKEKEIILKNNSSDDSIFLLKENDILSYLKNETDRVAKLSKNAVMNLSQQYPYWHLWEILDSEPNQDWWLQDADGSDCGKIVIGDRSSTPGCIGFNRVDNFNGVRPAMWIKI